jgi:hypothetical protein
MTHYTASDFDFGAIHVNPNAELKLEDSERKTDGSNCLHLEQSSSKKESENKLK